MNGIQPPQQPQLPNLPNQPNQREGIRLRLDEMIAEEDRLLAAARRLGQREVLIMPLRLNFPSTRHHGS